MSESESEVMSSCEEDDDDDKSGIDSDDTDTELQRAFEKGLIKPGLNVLKTEHDFEDRKKVKEYKNNVDVLKEKLSDVALLDLPWIERLDLVCGPAPLAPEIEQQIVEHKQRRENQLKQGVPTKPKKNAPPAPSIEDDPIHNDFKREMTFYRQAQAACLEGIERLKEYGVKTKRPENYYAEMFKSDNHMQRIRKLLLRQKVNTELSEKARRLREQKKMTKQMQREIQQQRQSEKKKLFESIKKYRKGQKDALNESDLSDLDLNLEGRTDMGNETKSNSAKKKPKSDGKGPKKDQRKSTFKRQMKGKKYGFGGQKKRSKYNTKESANFMEGKGKGKGKNKGSGGFNKGKKQVAKRPGKNKRKQIKSKRR